MTSIDYHGPRSMQENIETFVQNNIRPHIARAGVVPFYVGKLDHIEMRPVPHFIFDEEENRRVEEALEKYAHTEPSEQERIYQEFRELCLG